MSNGYDSLDEVGGTFVGIESDTFSLGDEVDGTFVGSMGDIPLHFFDNHSSGIFSTFVMLKNKRVQFRY